MKNDVLSLYWTVYWGSLIDILAMNIFLPVTFFLRYINNVSTLGSCFTLTISLYITQAAIEFSVELTVAPRLPHKCGDYRCETWQPAHEFLIVLRAELVSYSAWAARASEK